MITDANFAAIHGYLCSDGYVCTHKPHSKYVYYHVGFRNTCETLLLDFRKKFEKVYGTYPTITTQNDRCIKMNKSICLELLEQYGSFHSYKWTFPNMTRKAAKFWLRAFFDSEGWVTAIAGKDRAVSAESVNAKGLENIQKCLQDDFNIRSNISVRKNRNTSTLRICGRENIIEFKDSIGFLHPQKRLKLNEAIETYNAWRWNFPDKQNERLIYLRRALYNKFRPKSNSLRIFSRQQNLLVLLKFLKKDYGISGTIGASINGQGTKYYSLCFYGDNKQRLLELINHKSTTTCAS